MLQLADALPHRVSHLVNVDGLPSRRSFPDVADHQRTKLLAQELSSWLDHRRQLVTAQRRPGTIEELAARRGPHEPAALRRSGSSTSSPSGPATTPTAGAGRSTPRCASAASGRGGPSGR